MALDARIGIKNEDGSVATWPEMSMSGTPVQETVRGVAVPPARAMIGLDRLHFVVVGLFPPPGYKEEIERMRKSLERMGDAPTKRTGKNG